MAEALYRKYRPQVFGDVVGQEHIERTIKNAIEQDKVSHAYLFCGPRGTGKTTTARLLAKALLCDKGPTSEPDGTCQNCREIAEGIHPDVYELDAASHTGVDNVREEIIGRVQFAPTRGRWKVYIIDEAHMLSPAAFNALLKTLEEPPPHVVFILCTTDPQKILETIHSRCQRFDFHRISIESMVARLGAVCASEGVEFEAEALELIARRADGGMRNALTSLEQVIAFGEGSVKLEVAERLLGSLDSDEMDEIITAIGRRDAAACFSWTNEYVESGADLAQFVSDLAQRFRDLYILTLTDGRGPVDVTPSARASLDEELKLFGLDRLAHLLGIAGELAKELRASTNPRLSFEIALTRMVRPKVDLTLESLADRVEELERALASGSFATSAEPASTSASRAEVSPMRAARAEAPAAVHRPAAERVQPAPAMHERDAAAQAPFFGDPLTQPVFEKPVAGIYASMTQPSSAQGAAAPTAPSLRPAAQRQVQPAPYGTAPAEQQPAVQSAPQTPEPAVQAATPVASAQPPADVDLSNPAAVQRFWHAVTTALRKANPARGVLFMNAKVSAAPQGGIRISFTPENAFAYKAAQKPEVQQLLAQTLASVAGGSVLFELAGTEGSAAAPQRPAAPAAPSARPAPPAAAPSGSMPSTPASSAASRPAMQQGPQAATPAAPSAPNASFERMPRSSQPAYRPPAPEPDDDRPPLDVYDSFGYDDDAGYGAPAEAASSTPAPGASRHGSGTGSVSGGPASVSAAQSSSVAAPAESWRPAPSNPDAADGQSPIDPLEEKQHVKNVLIESFGPGVKFRDLPN